MGAAKAAGLLASTVGPSQSWRSNVSLHPCPAAEDASLLRFRWKEHRSVSVRWSQVPLESSLALRRGLEPATQIKNASASDEVSLLARGSLCQHSAHTPAISFPRTAHVHSDVRMLMATTTYREGSKDSTRSDVHITNMGINSAFSGRAVTPHASMSRYF